MSSLVVRSVTKSFGVVEVLGGIDLTVTQGSTTAIVGSSGCGKTTLLRIVAGFEVPDAGVVELGGTEIASGAAVVPAHKRGIGYVAQDGALFPHLTVRQNVMFGLPLRARRSTKRVGELLEMVSLDPEFASRRPDELSGGQQQRVALARALAREPRLMLLDEPFTALDAGLRASMRKSVAATLREAGVTTVLVTHDQEEALSFADQVAVMKSGRLTQVGPPQELYARPTDLFTATFLGDVVMLPARVSTAGTADCPLGPVPVPADTPLGDTRIMLRPEQIVATPTSTAHGSGTPGSDATNAVVLEREFLGHDSLLQIRLTPSDEVRARYRSERTDGVLSVRTVSVVAPEVGADVSLHVLGEAVRVG
ncbi:ABC transporter ATP-binding protein [Rhodococcus sp. D2-41]|uniref:ABC-type quaternary amine transporter n=1 Tax=Speluncibacter jeojiensis TaxID=2710754 RepID=A0A9X4M359_9ACTN|nr:ABC transporter ATP-binding protein [Rhodococcus sp. D2-41]MDG3009147.1 ABC transporter ATP-binding protein [Rhodococcus sp. D2-41]MDG3016180.1 ABC transporter ATP-binding protein [Corynebacteriales bacterium D3-21]